MKLSLLWLACAWTIGVASLAAAQETPADPAGTTEPAGSTEPVDEPAATAPAAPTDPEAIKLHLMDGSTICGKLSVAEIEIETSFGTLSVPITAIASFTPGLGSHPTVARDIAALIEDLGSSNFNRREAAHKQLLEMGMSVRAELEHHANDPDTERRSRVKELLEELDQLEEDLAEAEDPAGWGRYVLIDKDTVVTTDFTVVGQIVPQTFTIESQYGPLTVKLSDIRRGEREVGDTEIRKVVKVTGQHFAAISMAGTGIRLERGDTVSMAADGSINLSPWNQVSSPEGNQNCGWYVGNQIAFGALVAQVGANGPIFKVGSKSSFTADRGGVLYLGFAMQSDYANNNYQFPGEYKVRLRVVRNGN
jgi:hypothetical protein